MFSNGIQSQKEDLAFRPELLSLTDRGIVLSFPMVRGKCLLRDLQLLTIKLRHQVLRRQLVLLRDR